METVGRSTAKRELRERQRKWLVEIARATQLKPSQIASEAGVSDTTLTRLLNNPEYSGTLSQITIDRIKRRFNLPGPEDLRQGSNGVLLGFADAERFDLVEETGKGEAGRIVKAMMQGRESVEAWRLRSLCLENAGYLPNDILLIDTALPPRPHDAVCARVADWQRGASETIFRIFDPPFLIGAAREQLAYKPLLVDGERVSILGVVIEAYRPQRLSAAR